MNNFEGGVSIRLASLHICTTFFFIQDKLVMWFALQRVSTSKTWECARTLSVCAYAMILCMFSIALCSSFQKAVLPQIQASSWFQLLEYLVWLERQ